ncbi:MAG: hypothetical protein MUE88_07110 [Flavobacteriales bacterium]|jgi:hypothetical protein|nr:hypothetical protein [Flavobacteriales bacterium]
MLRLLLFAVLKFLALAATAQRIDSVHVFKWAADGRQTVASAHTLGWKLHVQKAPHTVLKGAELRTVSEAVQTYQPVRQAPGPLPELGYIAMVFSGGRPMVLGVTRDLDRLINLTARREYRLSGWEDHVYIRSLVAKLLVAH